MAIGDQYWDKVVLACHFDSGDGFKDYSLKKNTITASGNAAINTAQSKFGGASAYFDGAGDYLSVTSADAVMGSSDFTIEMWCYVTSVPTLAHLCGVWDATPNFSYQLYIDTNRAFGLEVSTTGQFQVENYISSANGAVPLNTWTHVACVRQGNSLMVFVNGTLSGTKVMGITGALNSASSTFKVGGNASSQFINGYIDDLRVTKGLARYTASFTPPTAALPFYAAQIQGTVKDSLGNFTRRLVRAHRRSDGVIIDEGLSDPSTGAFTLNTQDFSKHYAVVHDSDAWITYLPFNGDNGSTTFLEWGGKSVTAYGNAQISTAQSKFGGASAYFDGNGDYLRLPASNDLAFGTGDFTVEGWIRPTTVSAAVIVDLRNSIFTDGPVFYTSAAGKMACLQAPANVEKAGTTTLQVGTWYHLAWVRSSGVLMLFVNGVLEFSGAFSGYLNGYNTTVGADAVGAGAFNGYIDDLRISKGVARYVANFTPPTVPHFTQQDGDPYWNNVVLGMHMDGANGSTTFTDVKGKTVTPAGNAQISTAQSKFGGASAYFDGSGDYLKLPDSTALGMDGDITIEMWVRLTSISSTAYLINSNAGSGWYGDYISISTAGGVSFGLTRATSPSTNTGIYSSGGYVVAGVWTHIACCKTGLSGRIYVNGILVADGTFAENSPAGTTRGTWVGCYWNQAEGFVNGYIDDLRITKGVARYTANFTPPTQSFPEVLQTFGQQNALIYDHLSPV